MRDSDISLDASRNVIQVYRKFIKITITRMKIHVLLDAENESKHDYRVIITGLILSTYSRGRELS